jgi:hypothetical protein
MRSRAPGGVADKLTALSYVPQGEYGAGRIKVWDHGTYELEEWTNDRIPASASQGILFNLETWNL